LFQIADLALVIDPNFVGKDKTRKSLHKQSPQALRLHLHTKGVSTTTKEVSMDNMETQNILFI
jgi:hypothetical protein